MGQCLNLEGVTCLATLMPPSCPAKNEPETEQFQDAGFIPRELIGLVFHHHFEIMGPNDRFGAAGSSLGIIKVLENIRYLEIGSRLFVVRQKEIDRLAQGVLHFQSIESVLSSLQ